MEVLRNYGDWLPLDKSKDLEVVLTTTSVFSLVMSPVLIRTSMSPSLVVLFLPVFLGLDFGSVLSTCTFFPGLDFGSVWSTCTCVVLRFSKKNYR
jgi:hypothetical protein